MIAWSTRKFVSSPNVIKASTAGIVAVGATVGLVSIGVAAGPAVFVVGIFCAAAGVDKINRDGKERKKQGMTIRQLAVAPLALLLDAFFGPVPGTKKVTVGVGSNTPDQDRPGSSVPTGSTEMHTDSEAAWVPSKRKVKIKPQGDLPSEQMSRSQMPVDVNHDPFAPHGEARGVDRPGLKKVQQPEIKIDRQRSERADGTWMLTGETIDVDGRIYPWSATNVRSELTPGKPGTLNFRNGVKPSVKGAEETWYKIFPRDQENVGKV